jgi:hypothetical protein
LSGGDGGGGFAVIFVAIITIPIWLPFFLPAYYLWHQLEVDGWHDLFKIIAAGVCVTAVFQVVLYLFMKLSRHLMSAGCAVYLGSTFYIFSQIKSDMNWATAIDHLDNIWKATFYVGVVIIGFFLGYKLSPFVKGLRQSKVQSITRASIPITAILFLYVACVPVYSALAVRQTHMIANMIDLPGPAQLVLGWNFFEVAADMPEPGHRVGILRWTDPHVCVLEIHSNKLDYLLRHRPGYVKVRNSRGEIGWVMNDSIYIKKEGSGGMC